MNQDKYAIEIKTGRETKSHIHFVQSSVVAMHVDAIVNAANTTLLGGGGVDGAIHRAAGTGLLGECRRLNCCKTGEAKITGAYNIHYAKHIIHTVGPVYGGSSKDAELLGNCYQHSLDLSLKHNCKSIAFPCISTGVYGYPLDEAAKVSLNAVIQWLKKHNGIALDVYLCCYKERELIAYSKQIDKFCK